MALATSMRLLRFSYPRVVLRGLALSDVRGLCVLDAVVVAAVGDCYIVMVKVMVWTSSLSQLRCFALTALIVVERRLVALFVLMVGVSRLPTPLLRQWLLPHPVTWRGCDCLVALAAIDAPPALFYS